MTYSEEQYNAILAVCRSYKNDYDKAFERLKAQQQEINALQEENRRLDEYVSCTLSAQEFDEEIKQAKIDVLNELKRQAEHCDQWNCEVVPTKYLDEMIAEVKNAEDKS